MLAELRRLHAVSVRDAKGMQLWHPDETVEAFAPSRLENVGLPACDLKFLRRVQQAHDIADSVKEALAELRVLAGQYGLTVPKGAK